MFKVREASGEPSLWVARPIPGSTPTFIRKPQPERKPPWRGCNPRTKILSRSSNVFLREGITPHKALRGLSAPDGTDAGRLNSREVGGLWGLLPGCRMGSGGWMGGDDPSSAQWHLGAGAFREWRTHFCFKDQSGLDSRSQGLCSKYEATTWSLLAFLS